MTGAIRIEKFGGPEVMRYTDVPLEAPASGMVQVENRAIGVNFIDTYHRSGLYPIPLPGGIGMEGAGVVVATAADTGYFLGERVAYLAANPGAYAEAINVPAHRLVHIPSELGFETAAAALLKGQTVEFLIQRCYPLSPGERCLFHAAAGGVGLLFGQWARALGVEAIGTVSSAEKAAQARANGFAHVINYTTENVVQRVTEITGGEKLPVVYDGVGRDTFEISLDCLRPRGMMVSFGNASGPPEPLTLQTLAAKGSLYVTRPTLFSYTSTPEEFRDSANAVLERLGDARLSVEIQQRYSLAEAAQAHRDLLARKTMGSTILLPD